MNAGASFDPLAGLDADVLRELVHEQVADKQALQVELETLRTLNLEKRMNGERSRLRLRHIADIVAEQREPDWLIHRVLEANVLAVLAGPRSTFKSFIALHWSMKVAIAGKPVLILSGEGAGLDRRVDAWMRIHAPDADIDKLPVMALERPVNLNSQADIDALHLAIGEGGQVPALVVVDTFSKFAAGLDENSNAEVAMYLSRLSAHIRDTYKATVLLVAHSGHMDAKRPRGASVLMANPDAEYIVTRPDPTAMTVTVTRERFKDSPSLDALAYVASVVDLDREDRHGEPVTSLVLRPTDAPAPTAASYQLRGKNQRALLAALRERQKGSGTPLIWGLADLRAIGRDAVGMSKDSARSAVEAVALSPFMVPTVGGYRLADD